MWRGISFVKGYCCYLSFHYFFLSTLFWNEKHNFAVTILFNTIEILSKDVLLLIEVIKMIYLRSLDGKSTFLLVRV